MKPLDHFRLRLQYFLSRLDYGVCNYRLPQRRKIMRAILDQPRPMTLTPLEAYQLWTAAASTAKVEGDIAEVGVYQGASARLLSLALPEKQIHLFDTFEGLPDKTEVHHKGEFACSMESVQSYLPAAKLYRGLFPQETGHLVATARFSFVHLDMDIYEGTRDALAFFFERLSAGGVVMTHDFNGLPGPTKAFRDFFADRLDPLIELSGNQCLVVKLA